MDTRGRSPILYLCTGNYYRSRTAEALFNHYAQAAGLDAYATSSGLAVNAGNRGPISKYAVAWLDARGVPYEARYPRDVTLADLAAAARVIAVDESEHRPIMRARFPEWEDRVEYWMVHDIDRTSPDEALPVIEARVRATIAALIA